MSWSSEVDYKIFFWSDNRPSTIKSESGTVFGYVLRPAKRMRDQPTLPFIRGSVEVDCLSTLPDTVVRIIAREICCRQSEGWYKITRLRFVAWRDCFVQLHFALQ